jgi:hypothetical protein
MNSKTVIALVFGAAALVISACSSGSANDSAGGGNSASPSQTSNQPSAEFIAAAQTAATSSLLTLADFPAGWTQTPRNPNPEKLGLTGDCAVLESDGLPGDIAHAVSDDFIGPAEQDVMTGSSAFVDEASGQRAFDAYATTQSACADQFTVAYAKGLRDAFAAKGIAPDAVQDLVVSMTPQDPPGVGDASLSFRLLTTLSLQGQRMRFVLDAFLMREGAVLGYVSYYLRGDPDVTEEAQLTQGLATKLHLQAVAVP